MSVMVDGVEPREIYRSLRGYFSQKHVKIVSSHKPSIIRVEIGSFLPWTALDRKGRANFTILEKNGSSFVNMDFDFSNTYVLGLIVALVVALLILSIGLVIYSSLTSAVVSGLMGLLAFVLIMLVTNYHISYTKERFVNDLGTFLGSLSTEQGKLVRKVEKSNAD